MSGSRAERESLAIPASTRAEVDDRDGQRCRVCGEHLGETRALHHIRFGGGEGPGMGGRRVHELDNIATVGWSWPNRDCHTLVHSSKLLWQPLLLAVIDMPGVTALQLQRWQRRQQRSA